MERILFFDGVCVLCNSLVDFGLLHDQKKRFKFASLQGNTAKKLIPQFSHDNLNTIVLLDETGTYVESDAIIRFLMGLGGIYRITIIFTLLPKGLRDWLYRCVAKNRYRWFGKTENCRLPSPEEKNRILD